MAKNLVIVESPAKARTISQYLGNDFEVKSTFGHIRDLPKKDLGVDVAHNFEPKYEISPDKKQVASELKTAAKNREVWLASDEDREGEAIAWHVCHILGIDPKKTHRIVFHEITKPAIEQAIAMPRTVNKRLVDAQQARRVLDRLVGYELSPILWKKVRTGLSAGRVQSVAVRLIVERENEIKDHISESNFKVTANFSHSGGELPAELSTKLPDAPAARKFVGEASTASFSVLSADQKPAMRSPSPPFTTSTLQQEAARRLGYGVKQTMALAQKLYENGHITYMRTDSTTLSPLAVTSAKAHIEDKYGKPYSAPKQYQTKVASAQEAHEAIRPTNFDKQSAGEGGESKLYELIWRRALASQMAPAQIDRTEIKIDISGRQEYFIARGEVLRFDGFYKVYGGSKDDLILPDVKTGDKLSLISLAAAEQFSRPPARYSEASLVKKMEELGIGRPSTYAPTISTIQNRGYVQKIDLEGEEKPALQICWQSGKLREISAAVRTGADRNKLVPTELGKIVSDFLVKYFSEIVDYAFTARAESQLDQIAEGKIEWQKMLEEFYQKFHPLIAKTKDVSRNETLQVKRLGIDPKTKKPVYARFGRFGPVLQLGESPAKEDKSAPKPKFAPLPEGEKLDTINLESALPMFRFPRDIGETNGQRIIINIGPYGPYLKVGTINVSLKGHDLSLIGEKEAIGLIEQKQKAAKDRIIADFGQIKIIRGPYGPYISDGKKNARIKKGVDPKSIDENAAKEELLKAPKKGKFAKRSRKKS